MPWQIGIDEAGYGPNLGPFVMTLVACQLPEVSLDPWEAMRQAVRRVGAPADDRLIVADSKQVYSSSRGWDELERTVLSASPWHEANSKEATTLKTLLSLVAETDLASLDDEHWFEGDTPLPTVLSANALAASRASWHASSRSANLFWGACQCAIVPAPRFNDLVDRWDSKGAVLGVSLAHLLDRCLKRIAPEPTSIVVDKHGGRNRYVDLLQHTFPGGLVLPEEESRARSIYRIESLDRPMRISFMPKADAMHFTVALASMISKYVRELLMGEFNRFWQSHVPGLESTAGYPVDAIRFIKAIRPALLRLGIEERLVWRCR